MAHLRKATKPAAKPYRTTTTAATTYVVHTRTLTILRAIPLCSLLNLLHALKC